ncbi:MAG: DUF523 and DUF1722 domain-containing protein [Cellvibrionales bacterium]|nr:DUF523 and DUF1722 domain-containing protein [Cellvibrionales bacterium]
MTETSSTHTQANTEINKPVLGLSSCLSGERVRFDGGHKRHSYITDTLGQFFEFHLFCPEVAIGLGIPRPPIRLVSVKSPTSNDTKIRCVGVKDPDQDVTEELQAIAEKQFHWVKHLNGYIVKKDSPSCGMERVKVFHGQGKTAMPEKTGTGLFTASIMKRFPLLPVEEEGRLGDPVLRENFIERVYMHFRWQTMINEGITAHKLLDFHSRHKFNLLSHNQRVYRQLGRFISGVTNATVDTIAHEYIHTFMAAMKKNASRGSHVNVMQHLAGFLKNDLEAIEKDELNRLFSAYLKGDIPRIAPITLLNHFFIKYPNDYVSHSYYLTPYPDEMRLLNAT